MIGQTVSHYRILEQLGEGGMGVVYKAEDLRLKRTVALKFLPREIRDDTAKKRFLHEAQAASSLEHPNICSIHEIDQTPDDRAFIVMPCYDGESLQQRLERGPLEWAHAVSVAAQVASGLTKAHENGIVHRDIKPGNIMLTGDGLVKILDFGLAKLSGRTKLTRTGTAPGTVSYMSPEQFKGDAVDQRADIWALGVVLYEMVTGQPPFSADYEQAVMYSIVNEEPKAVRGLQPDIPADLELVIDRMLSKDPGDRYQTAGELGQALQSLNAGPAQPVPRQTGAPDDIPSIAVLPFANISPDPENAYFADGLAEELINALTQLDGLRVAARTSAFSFRGGDVDIREIGRKLNVKTVLEGSVRKAGTRLRVTAQLVNIHDGYHIWSERYDREMEDIFNIQDEITASIVEQLKVQLIGEKSAPRVKRYTDNLEAYSLFLKAQHRLFTLTKEGWEESFKLYRQAVDLDPSFALPYVSLSQIYQSQCFWGDAAPADAMPKSREAAEKALDLDDSLSVARSVLAVIYWVYDWDFDRSEREFLRSAELDPTEPFNHINYSLFLASTGRLDEAIVEARLGQKLDPLSSTIHSWSAITLSAAGRHDEAFESLQHAVSLNPNDWQPYINMAAALLRLSRIEEARTACIKATNLSGGASIALTFSAAVEYLAGNKPRSNDLLQQLTERSRNSYVAPSLISMIYTARGEPALAIKHLEEAVSARDSWVVLLDNIRPAQLRPAGPEVDAILAPVRRRQAQGEL
ncbi:MAG: protein kinase, partial [Candidatus Latescibacterota bacterium]|jgi:serine/threonine-protein kinase